MGIDETFKTYFRMEACTKPTAIHYYLLSWHTVDAVPMNMPVGYFYIANITCIPFKVANI